MLSTKYGKLVYGRCAKTKRVTWAIGFVCDGCVDKKIVEPDKELSLYDQVEFVKSSCYLGDRFNVSSGRRAAFTAGTKIESIKFRECGKCTWKKAFIEN